MKKHAPDVREYMTHLPVEAEKCESISDALAIMRAHRVRHLPVMSGSHVKGLVSLPELLAAQTGERNGGDNVSLEQVCQTEILKVTPVTPIDEVARELLQRDVDCAVVLDGGFVVGIFTTTDALRFICDSYGESNPGSQG